MPSELQEAITAASTVTPLIQKQIDPLLLEYQRRYSPVVAATPTRQWGSTQYYFNRRTLRPDAGGVLDGGARPIGNSTYEQNVYNIRLLQAVGSVTGFAQVVTRDLIGDLRQLEIDGTVQSMLWTIENAMLWGHDGATANGQYPIFSGLDFLVNNYTAGTGSNAFVNALDLSGNNFSLARLDELIDLVETNAAMPIGENYMFIMSPRMASAISQAVMPLQRFNAPTVQLAAGLNVPSYRDVPIIKSSFVAPRTSQMSTVTATAYTSPSGTNLPNGTYRYVVSAVVARFGETQVCAEVSATPSSQAVRLDFSTPTGLPDGLSPILYKVYRTAVNGASGTEQFLGVVDAFDTAGTATTRIVDDGVNLWTTNSGANSVTATSAATYQGRGSGQGSSATDVTNTVGPRGYQQEEIYLVPRDANFACRPYTRDVQVIPLAPTVTSPDTLPFALVTDCTYAIRAPKYVGRLSRVVANI